ncbi:MAG TPA: bifunctional riboflavin kinase/FAD synthetase [Dehalococcoidia bacterium]|nr:bifunctional riboflavin kinase/FAD synthetase [Dehalococcoidia bacterium]
MLLETELARHRPERDSFLAIGVFDGVHLGHQHLIAHLRQRAQETGWLGGVVTLRHHPLEVLSPGVEPAYLTSLEERTQLLHQSGADFVAVVSFTPEVAQMRASQFLESVQRQLRMRGLVAGPDFALGRDREGDTAALKALGDKMGFIMEVVPPKMLEAEVVSSTAIRRALGQGDMPRVSQLLGRPYRLSGRVVSGVERGRQLGFPTANLEIEPTRAIPADGVYITRAYLSQRAHPSVTNIGLRPTFGGQQRTVEVFLLDYQGDLYGEELSIELVKRLRGEIAFASAAELQEQIERDVEQARAWLQE